MSMWVDHKFAGLLSLRLDRFKKKNDKLYVFRCPFCGDSQKDKSKTRGYLYENKDHLAFKCHNCGLSTSFSKLLDHIDLSLGKAYKLEKFSQQQQSNVIFTLTESTVIQPTVTSTLESVGLISLNKLNADHRVIEYVKSRKIPTDRYVDLYYAKDMRMLEQLNPAYKDRLLSEERLIVPYYDKLGSLSGVTGRALGNSKKRYINVRLSEFPMMYGLKDIDTTKDIYVIEGAFDSMFVSNALAVGGSDLQRAINLFTKDQLILVFDNEPRNKQIVNIMEKMINYGYRLVIWPKTWQYKDINEAIVSGKTKEEISTILYTNTHKSLPLKLAIRDWKKC